LRYVLNAQLLRLPGITLDDDWEPNQATVDDISKAIVELLAAGKLDWFDSLRSAG
jgi:hypothetical protein